MVENPVLMGKIPPILLWDFSDENYEESESLKENKVISWTIALRRSTA